MDIATGSVAMTTRREDLMLSLILALQTTVVANPRTQPVNPPLASSTLGRDRLASQFVRGIQRICIYGTGQTPRALAVGRGEPCPGHYHPVEAEVPTIPAMAMLASQFRVEGRLIC